MIEVRITAVNAEGFVWVGHGVGNTVEDAEGAAAFRMPEGYSYDPVDDVATTREGVDPDTIHPDWVY